MHILQCYKTAVPLSHGGIEQTMHQIAQGLVERGHEATILTFSPEKKVRELCYGSYKIVVVPATKEIASMPLSMRGFSYYKTLCLNADVVHFHYPFPWADLMHLIHPHDKPCVMTYQSDIIKQKYLSKLYKPLQMFFLNRMNAIVATSPAYIETSLILKKYQDKLSCIPIGLDERSYINIPKGAINAWKKKLPRKFLLFIGVFRYYKGLSFLLKALEGLDYPLVLIGDGPERQEFMALSEKLKLKNIYFLGQLDDGNKNAILSLSSGVILPSHLRSEAFGLALVEGALFGKPLISCELGTGTSFINQDKKTGWVVRPGDIYSLREALKEWFNSDELCLNFGKSARKNYEDNFDASAMVLSYVNLYESLC